jgi:aromatic ring-cleaving dioxygenase
MKSRCYTAWASCTTTSTTQEEHIMAELKGYHAHVYYDAATKPIAERLRNTIIGKFAVKPGAFSDEPRGPHPVSQFNVIFEAPEFQNIVPWLMLNREGLNILVHPLTESNYDDHSKYAVWLGTPVSLKLERLSANLPEALLPTTQRA